MSDSMDNVEHAVGIESQLASEDIESVIVASAESAVDSNDDVNHLASTSAEGAPSTAMALDATADDTVEEILPSVLGNGSAEHVQNGDVEDLMQTEEDGPALHVVTTGEDSMTREDTSIGMESMVGAPTEPSLLPTPIAESAVPAHLATFVKAESPFLSDGTPPIEDAAAFHASVIRGTKPTVVATAGTTSKLAQLTARIEKDPYDGEAQLALLAEVEAKGDLERTREVYEEFLRIFPNAVSILSSCSRSTAALDYACSAI